MDFRGWDSRCKKSDTKHWVGRLNSGFVILCRQIIQMMKLSLSTSHFGICLWMSACALCCVSVKCELPNYKWAESFFLEMCSGSQLSFVANAGSLARVLRVLISVSHFLLWCFISFGSYASHPVAGGWWAGVMRPTDPWVPGLLQQHPLLLCFFFLSTSVRSCPFIRLPFGSHPTFHSITMGMRPGANLKWQLPWWIDQLSRSPWPRNSGNGAARRTGPQCMTTPRLEI